MKRAGWLIALFLFSLLGALAPISLAQDDQAASSVVSGPVGNEPSAVPAVPPARPAGNIQRFFPIIIRRPIAVGFALDIFNLTNSERANAGCPPLRLNAQLTQAAQGHAADMALNDFFSHTGSNGSSPWNRINATGYQFASAGENIAAGYSTPQAAMNGWMNSPGHRANILNCAFQDIGVGYYYRNPDPGQVTYRHYWVQVFARPA